jgi:hypothetical protein
LDQKLFKTRTNIVVTVTIPQISSDYFEVDQLMKVSDLGLNEVLLFQLTNYKVHQKRQLLGNINQEKFGLLLEYLTA